MKKRKLAVAFMLAGVLLVTGALTLYLYNKWDENRASDAAVKTAQVLSRLISENKTEQPPDETDEAGQEGETVQSAEPAPAILYDGKSYIGVLAIPALELSLPVMETWSYPNLKVSPCKYTGNARDGDMVVMAHNYSRHFGNISLLSYGDTITFVDAAGEEYVYEVSEIETVNSGDIKGMVENDFDLTLFTCTYGGQARIAVRCVRV